MSGSHHHDGCLTGCCRSKIAEKKAEAVRRRKLSQEFKFENEAHAEIEAAIQAGVTTVEYNKILQRHGKMEYAVSPKKPIATPLTVEKDPATRSAKTEWVPQLSVHTNCVQKKYVRRVSHTDRNPNRAFWKCLNCRYFEWEDDLQVANRMHEVLPPKQ